MNFQPSFNWHVVEPDEIKEKVVGGFKIPVPQLSSVAKKGVIIASGPGVTTTEGVFIPTEHKVGDHIFFGESVAYPIPVEENGVESMKNYLIVKDWDIRGRYIPE